MGIHPNCLYFKGSTKIGFSIAPKAAKVWMEFGPPSDLDLAIVDPHFFQMVDSEVRRWEWRVENRGRVFRNPRLFKEHLNRNYHKGKFDCFRFFDLPRIACMEEARRLLEKSPRRGVLRCEPLSQCIHLSQLVGCLQEIRVWYSLFNKRAVGPKRPSPCRRR